MGSGQELRYAQRAVAIEEEAGGEVRPDTLGMLIVALLVGVEQWGGRIGLALAAAATAAMATTEYRVLALTSDGLVLLRSSRVRQKAGAIIGRLPASTRVEPVGSNLVITDWSVGDTVYSVMKRHQAAMVAISQR